MKQLAKEKIVLGNTFYKKNKAGHDKQGKINCMLLKGTE